jgi:hypothetical protein
MVRAAMPKPLLDDEPLLGEVVRPSPDLAEHGVVGETLGKAIRKFGTPVVHEDGRAHGLDA